jgi:hypothetical protein
MARVWKDIRNSDNGELLERVCCVDDVFVATICIDDGQVHWRMLGTRGYGVCSRIIDAEDAIRRVLDGKRGSNA